MWQAPTGNGAREQELAVRNGTTICRCAIRSLIRPRLHVLRDLAPYICLNEQCESPHTRYRSTKEWYAHMDEVHQQHDWVCQTCCHSFQDQKSFEEHFRRADLHGTPVRLRSEDLALVVKTSAVPRTFPSCLFCGLNADEIEGDIRLHMAEHLRNLALASLPWHVLTSGSSENDSHSAIAGARSKAENSSIARMEDEIDEVTLSFDDLGDTGVPPGEWDNDLSRVKRIPALEEEERKEMIADWSRHVDSQSKFPALQSQPVPFESEPPTIDQGTPQGATLSEEKRHDIRNLHRTGGVDSTGTTASASRSRPRLFPSVPLSADRESLEDVKPTRTFSSTISTLLKPFRPRRKPEKTPDTASPPDKDQNPNPFEAEFVAAMKRRKD
jgi:hypothetical protein